MPNATVTKGYAVEVSSDEPGFEGAWYAATFITEVESSPTKKRASNKKTRKEKKTGYLVKYETLLVDDGSLQPLTEVVDPSLVRPLPPRDIRREDGEVVEEFEVYDVVDSYHRDGWWIGVVKTVIDEGEMKKYVVEFENPTEEFEFERCKLRLHVDWIDCRWVVPPKKTPGQESGDRNTTHDDSSGFITPSKGARIINVDNETVGPASSAKKNSRTRKRSESNSAVDGSVTRGKASQSSAGVGNTRGANMDGLARLVGFGFGSKGKTKATAPVLEAYGSDDILQDSTPVESAIIITQMADSEDGTSQQTRKRGRKPKLVVKKPIGLLRGHGVTTDLDEQPLSVWYQGMHPFSVLRRNSCFSPLGHHAKSLSQAIVPSGATSDSSSTTTDYQQDWPFIKRSPVWATIDSLELYLTPPQKPHFSPLKELKADYREGLAIAQMVTFGNLVQNLSGLQPNDPVDIINNNLETLSDLKANGFDVGPIRDRLTTLLSLKSNACEHEATRKEVEKEIKKCTHEKSLVEKEMDELEVKMQVLKEKTAQTASMMKVKEDEHMSLQANLLLVSNQIKEVELAFEKLAATPL
ncbi:hypothetical protein L1987_84462 [Smallanthus sonchifolius]|uniref:Uncharacterized protein n=1 Tax=Smallanthus sonchifolius TaxID=185202 RepID=A0ACB8YFX3_9ASTR|nr:hypothetical protein L1987_84462 [Smallanthus sonchifolius]